MKLYNKGTIDKKVSCSLIPFENVKLSLKWQNIIKGLYTYLCPKLEISVWPRVNEQFPDSIFRKLIIFNCGSWVKVTCRGKLWELNTFQSQKVSSFQSSKYKRMLLWIELDLLNGGSLKITTTFNDVKKRRSRFVYEK